MRALYIAVSICCFAGFMSVAFDSMTFSQAYADHGEPGEEAENGGSQPSESLRRWRQVQEERIAQQKREQYRSNRNSGNRDNRRMIYRGGRDFNIGGGRDFNLP